ADRGASALHAALPLGPALAFGAGPHDATEEAATRAHMGERDRRIRGWCRSLPRLLARARAARGDRESGDARSGALAHAGRPAGAAGGAALLVRAPRIQGDRLVSARPAAAETHQDSGRARER